MKKLMTLGLAILAFSLWAGNSIFSYYGYPVQFYGRDVYSMGMGDSGASDIFRYNTGYTNPAQTNRDNKSLFGTGIIAGYTNYKSEYQGTERSFRDDALDFPYFSVSVPVKKHRIGFQYNSYASGVVNNQYAYPDSTIERQESDKYIFRTDLIYTFSYKNLNLGISGNYYFGHDKRTFEQTSATNTVPTRESLLRSFKNPTLSFGALSSFDKHSVGMHLTLPVTLEGESKRSSTHTTEPAEDYTLDLPLQYAVSYTALPMPQLKVAVDANYEMYSEVDESYRDGIKLGLGLAYEPEKGQKYWYRGIPLRAGLWYRQLPFKDARNNADIDEMAYTMGFTLPLKNEVSRVDFALQYLSRGSLEENKLSDRSLMFSIGITGFDIFSKAPDRTAPRDIPIAEDLQAW